MRHATLRETFQNTQLTKFRGLHESHYQATFAKIWPLLRSERGTAGTREPAGNQETRKKARRMLLTTFRGHVLDKFHVTARWVPSYFSEQRHAGLDTAASVCVDKNKRCNKSSHSSPAGWRWIGFRPTSGLLRMAFTPDAWQSTPMTFKASQIGTVTLPTQVLGRVASARGGSNWLVVFRGVPTRRTLAGLS